MTYIPLGFTKIDGNYTRLDPVPSVTGTKSGVELQNLFNQEFVVFEEVEQVFVPSTDNQETFSIFLAATTNYPAVNSTASLNVEVSRNRNTQGTLVLRLLTPISTDYQNRSAIAVPLAAQLVQTISVNLTIGSTPALLQVLVHPLYTESLPSLEISEQEYNQLRYRSNVITLFVNNAPTNTPDTVPSNIVRENPLLDAVPTLTENLLRTVVIDQILDLAPTNPQPHGSQGEGIYKDVGIPSPKGASMHKKVPSESLQRLLGMALDQLKRLEGWSSKVLHRTHSHKSPLENSELNLLLGLLPDDIKEAIERYTEFVDEAGKYATDIAKTYAPDYAQGNTIVKSHAVEQHNVGQFRTQTSSVFDVNSPSINLAAQQSVVQARFEHHVGDTYQGSHLHYFVRAEDQLTQMSANDIKYASNTLTEFSANTQRVTGAKVQYQDAEFDQVGQSTNTPIHPTNTNVESVNDYGNSTKLVHKDYNLVTSVGEIVMNSGTHIHIHAKQGDLRLSASQNVRVDSGINLTIKASQNAQINASQNITVSGQMTRLSATSNVMLRGRMVFINSGGSVTVPSSATPKILDVEPKTFQPLKDPVPYDKTNPVSPGPVGQAVPNTPEPNQTPAGDSQLGAFLTNQG